MLNYNIKILDNFLNEKDFDELAEYAKQLDANKRVNIYHNEIDQNNNIISSSINPDLIKRLNKNYLSKTKNILQELSSEKIKLISHSDFTIIKTNKNAKFPIHDDAPNKLLSGVIFLYPKKNTGTIFYNKKNGEGKTEIDWKLNRGVFFSRKERETWHSYQGDGINDRIALVYNLMTKKNNIKEVCEIEKKNYILSLLRFKINPYLYQILGKTI